MIESPQLTCPRCGSTSVNSYLQESSSEFLIQQRNFKAGMGCTATIALLLAFFTAGISLLVWGIVLAVVGVYRLLTLESRRERLQSEEARCTIFTCRICRQQWIAQDWSEIHQRSEQSSPTAD